jgi:pyrrolidone-carboxylate peptidase
LNDLGTNSVRTAKFSSIGKLAGRETIEKESLEINVEGKKGSDEDSSSNEDTKKRDVLR